MSTDKAYNEQVKAVFSKLAQVIHPDKVGEQFKAEATTLFQKANAAKRTSDLATLQAMLAAYEAGQYFIDYAAQVTDMLAAGKTKTQVKAYATYKGWPKSAFVTIDELTAGQQRAGSADKTAVVKSIITMQKLGINKATMVKNLMQQFSWAEGTAKTVVAHVDYMQAYAKVVNGE